MKQALILSCLLLLASCEKCFSPDAPKPLPAAKSVLNIIINDISQSNYWLQLPKAEVLQLLLQDSSCRPSIQVAGLLIQDSSQIQQPYLSGILMPGLSASEGDIFERTETDQQNLKAMAAFKTQARLATDSLLAWLGKPHSTLQSDVNGALTLACQLANQTCYANWDIRLIILSDLLQDTHDGRAIHAFIFPGGTIIYLIGKSDQVTDTLVFPQNTIRIPPAFKAQFMHR